jgi:VIT1/CCC1 family predicted Fe2+/Mn2+ transporter
MIPLLPFLLGLVGMEAVCVAAAITAASLFGVGTTLSLFTGRGALRGGLRMVAIGGGAGIVTWLIGSLVGVAAS